MTVLAKYQRLEAEAVWRPSPEAQRRDVIVSIGKATLTIAKPNGTALSHWSLPAIVRLNPGETPALYTPGENMPETLELSDPEMIGAIDSVLRAIRRGTSRPGRVRALAFAATGAALVAAALIWLPDAITRYAASLVPQGARTEIGSRMRAEVRRLTGAPCAEPAGLRALERLQSRLFPEGGVTLTVVPSALAETAHLPGGIILIGHKLVEDHEVPDVLAGYLIAENLRRQSHDPLNRLLADAGLAAALHLLTTGRIEDGALRRNAEHIVAATPAPIPEPQLLRHFAIAGVPAAPYAYAVDFSGKSTQALIRASADPANLAPLLGDGDWIALQQICEG